MSHDLTGAMSAELDRRRLFKYVGAGALALGIPAAMDLKWPSKAWATENWSRLSLPGGIFSSFDVSVGSSPTNRIFAGSDDSGGLYYSDSDQADPSWTRASTGYVNTTGWQIYVSPQNSSRIYAVDQYARHPVLRSTDRGATWTDIGTGLSGDARRAISIIEDTNDSSGNTVWIGTGAGANPYNGNGVWKGVLSGGTWSWTQMGPAHSGGHGVDAEHSLYGAYVPFLVQVSGYIFAAVAWWDCDHQDANHLPGLYVWNAGTSQWDLQAFSSGSGLKHRQIQFMTIAPTHSGQMLLSYQRDGSSAVTYAWNYSGDPSVLGNNPSWQQASSCAVWSVIAGPPDPNYSGKATYLCADLNSNVYYGVDVNADQNFSWTAATGLPGTTPSPMSLCVHPSGAIYTSLLTGQGIYRSGTTNSSGVYTFAAANSSVYAAYVEALTVSSNNDYIYAAMMTDYDIFSGQGATSAVLRSTDGGANWATGTSAVIAHGKSIAVNPDSTDKILLGTFSDGLYLSTNASGNMTFSQQTGGTNPIGTTDYVSAVMWAGSADHAVASVVDFGDASGCPPTGSATARLVYSTDGGVSWANAGKSIAAVNFGIGAIASGQSYKRLWAVGQRADSSKPGIYYSDDRGATWTQISVSGLTAQDYRCVIADTTNANHVIVGGDDQKLWDITLPSTQASYTILPGGSTVGPMTSLLYQASRILAGFSGSEQSGNPPGAIYTTSNLSTWTQVESGLVSNHVRSQMVARNFSGTALPIAPIFGEGVAKLNAS